MFAIQPKTEVKNHFYYSINSKLVERNEKMEKENAYGFIIENDIFLSIEKSK